MAKLTATDAVESDHFGESVAIHSSLVVVGAPHHDDADWDSGAVYGSAPRTAAPRGRRLRSLPRAMASRTPSSVLGRSSWQLRGGGRPRRRRVSRRGLHLLAAGSGAYVQVAKIVASDGAKDDRFGYSVAFFGDIVAIGARDHDHAACKMYDYDDDYMNSDCGSVYIFHTSDGGATFVQVAKLKMRTTPHPTINLVMPWRCLATSLSV